MTKQDIKPKRKPKATFLAYMAACFDMRGHVSIAKKDGRVRMRISVPQQFMATSFRDVYGGSIYKCHQYDSAANWTWEAGTKGTLVRVAIDLYPYVRQQTPLQILTKVQKKQLKWQDATHMLTEFYTRWYPRWEKKE